MSATVRDLMESLSRYDPDTEVEMCLHLTTLRRAVLLGTDADPARVSLFVNVASVAVNADGRVLLTDSRTRDDLLQSGQTEWNVN